jgi:hypothetical protein
MVCQSTRGDLLAGSACKCNLDFPNDSQEERSENRTVSTVEFEPGVEDHGKSITCRAENPNVTGLFVERSWKIDVVCE